MNDNNTTFGPAEGVNPEFELRVKRHIFSRQSCESESASTKHNTTDAYKQLAGGLTDDPVADLYLLTILRMVQKLCFQNSRPCRGSETFFTRSFWNGGGVMSLIPHLWSWSTSHNPCFPSTSTQ